MQTMRWGIHYGREPASKSSQAINARCENIIEGAGMWNKFRGKNRCVVVSQGYNTTFLPLHMMMDSRCRYYEWQTKGKDKLPHFIKHPDGKVMLMAGLYDETVDKSPFFFAFACCRNIIITLDQSQQTYTFAIVTTDATKGLSWLHDRQPVIFSTVEEINQWLDTSRAWSTNLARLLHPWEETKGTLQWYAPRPDQSVFYLLGLVIKFQRKSAKSAQNLSLLSSRLPTVKMVSWPCSPSRNRNKMRYLRNGNALPCQLQNCLILLSNSRRRNTKRRSRNLRSAS